MIDASRAVLARIGFALVNVGLTIETGETDNTRAGIFIDVVVTRTTRVTWSGGTLIDI